MSYRFHINCNTSNTTMSWGHHDMEFTTHPTWKEVCDSNKHFSYMMIDRIFNNVVGQPKLDDKIIPNIEYKMKDQNGNVGWFFMLFT